MKQKGNVKWVVLLIILACAIWAYVAYATTVKDAMRYENTITHIGAMTQTGNTTRTGTLTNTGALNVTGDVTITGGLSVSDEITVPPYEHASTSGALTWATAYGHVLILTGTTPITVTLPAITSAMNGYLLTIKNASGATTRTVTPNAANTIESTRGTTTGTSDTTLDAAGDVATWMALYSGTTPYWSYLHKELT